MRIAIDYSIAAVILGVVKRQPETLSLSSSRVFKTAANAHCEDFEQEVVSRLSMESICKRLLEKLPIRSEDVLRARYWDDESLKSIGDRIGMTKEGIRCIESRALRAIRDDQDLLREARAILGAPVRKRAYVPYRPVVERAPEPKPSPIRNPPERRIEPCACGRCTESRRSHAELKAKLEARRIAEAELEIQRRNLTSEDYDKSLLYGLAMLFAACDAIDKPQRVT